VDGGVDRKVEVVLSPRMEMRAESSEVPLPHSDQIEKVNILKQMSSCMNLTLA